MTVLEHVGAATTRLDEAGLEPDTAAFDAEVLARHVLGWNRAAFVCNRGDAAPSVFPTRYTSVLDRRARREPVSLIVGHREFWGLEFEVTRSVLTPRPETELLVEETLGLFGDHTSGAPDLVDVGTGSGCVSVALALELPHARVTATDVSASALVVARRNAERHGVGDRITWIHGPYLDALSITPDVIVANPPYIPDADTDTLPAEVRNYEPRIALVGGRDGLDAIRGVLSAAEDRLSSGGYLVMEFGVDQVSAVQDAVRAHRQLAITRIRDDLQGIPRTVVIQHR